jgi:molybdopterin/thiamine biosynthesis adenylyltransferase
MNEQFLRVEMLLGEPALKILSGAHVAVFGLGGVGSWCAEALARSGVGELTLIDHDEVGLTNLNRQAQALHSTLGKPKAEAMAARIGDINPGCRVHPLSLPIVPIPAKFVSGSAMTISPTPSIWSPASWISLKRRTAGASPSSLRWVPAISLTRLCCG